MSPSAQLSFSLIELQVGKIWACLYTTAQGSGKMEEAGEKDKLNYKFFSSY